MDLTDVLEQHRLWLVTSGREGRRADLSGADLRGANLRGVDLSGVILRGADLRAADLIGANLRGANLSGADLSGADLSGADLRGANLRGANLSGTGLIGADLIGANLIGANLSDADLSGANLSGASLHNADLSGANLSGANPSDADLIGANLIGAIGLTIAADAPQRLLAVARAALATDSALQMDEWHTCKTTHCIAGWAIHQAGEPGRLLEETHGPEVAGRMLLGHDAAMHFHDSNDDARAWLQSVLDAAEAGEVGA